MKKPKNWNGVPVGDDEAFSKMMDRVDRGRPYMAPVMQAQVLLITFLLMAIATGGVALLLHLLG